MGRLSLFSEKAKVTKKPVCAEPKCRLRRMLALQGRSASNWKVVRREEAMSSLDRRHCIHAARILNIFFESFNRQGSELSKIEAAVMEADAISRVSCHVGKKWTWLTLVSLRNGHV